MKTEAALLSEIASATTFREQAALVAELDAVRAAKTASVQAERDWDAAGAIVEQTLAPVLTHSFHTASTDWLSEVDTTFDSSGVANAMHAEAALWFGKTSSMVKEDHDEFAEQAKGYARRLASQYGERSAEATQAFLDYAAFLHRREAASGLPQIQQLIDGNNQPSRTEMPTDVFDTFEQPVAPENVGADEQASSYNAPLMNEILQEGGGQGQAEKPNSHDTAPQTTQNPMGGNGMQVGNNSFDRMASLSGDSLEAEGSLIDTPTLAAGYLYNLDEFLAAQQVEAQVKTANREDREPCAAHGRVSCEACADSSDCSSCGSKAKPDTDGECPRCGTKRTASLQIERVALVREGERPAPTAPKEAASSLPQVQQLINVHDEVDPRPLNTEVAFPLIPYFDDEPSTEDNKKEGSRDPFVAEAPASDVFTQVRDMVATGSLQVEADQFTQGPPQVGTDNPILNETHNTKAEAAADPTNAEMKAQADFAKGANYAKAWTPDTPLVSMGSVDFEAGVYAGISENREHQDAWLQAHAALAPEHPDLADRIGVHAAFTAEIRAQAATTTDLETMEPGVDPSPAGDTPINGPGTVPPLAGGQDPAAPGGASPYNGAAPYGKPVAPDPGWSDPQRRQAAFRQAVQDRLAQS